MIHDSLLSILPAQASAADQFLLWRPFYQIGWASTKPVSPSGENIEF